MDIYFIHQILIMHLLWGKHYYGCWGLYDEVYGWFYEETDSDKYNVTWYIMKECAQCHGNTDKLVIWYRFTLLYNGEQLLHYSKWHLYYLHILVLQKMLVSHLKYYLLILKTWGQRASVLVKWGNEFITACKIIFAMFYV